jgi:very-short-patch-repair endonuclease
VYALGHTALPPFGVEMAALFACGPRAAIGVKSAAHMWRLLPERPDRVDVIVVGRKLRQRTGIHVHRRNALMRSELGRIQDIPVTSPARTILDLATTLTEPALENALHEAVALRLVTVGQVQELLRHHRGRRGSAALARLTDPARRLGGTQSGAEERLRRALRRARLPQPHTRHRIGPWTLDFYWPETRMGVEVDGADFHSTTPRLERDHLKDQELRVLYGVLVLRFTARQVVRDLEYVLAMIAREYERRSSSG